MVFSPSSRSRLTARDRDRFAGGTVFDRLALALCDAGCLPRKELYEAWEVARRARRLFRGGRVVDLGAGHGLLAHAMLILDDSSPSAIAVDKARTPCAGRVQSSLLAAWPRLADRVTFLASDLDAVPIAAFDVVVSSHACGRLTDAIIERAIGARARVAVLPCCHDFTACDTGGLEGWLEPALAIDTMRAARLRAAGYRVWTQIIRGAITPKNRLLLAAPEPASRRTTV